MFTLEQYTRNYLTQCGATIQNRDGTVGFVLINRCTKQESFIPFTDLKKTTLVELNNKLGIYRNNNPIKIPNKKPVKISASWSQLEVGNYSLFDGTGNSIVVNDAYSIKVSQQTQCYASQLGIDSVYLDEEYAMYFLFKVKESVIDEFVRLKGDYETLREPIGDADFIYLLQHNFIKSAYCIQREDNCDTEITVEDLKLFQDIIIDNTSQFFICAKLYQNQFTFMHFIDYKDLSTFIANRANDVTRAKAVRVSALFNVLSTPLAMATLCSNLIDLDYVIEGALHYSNYIMPMNLPADYTLEEFYNSSYGQRMITEAKLYKK